MRNDGNRVDRKRNMWQMGWPFSAIASYVLKLSVTWALNLLRHS